MDDAKPLTDEEIAIERTGEAGGVWTDCMAAFPIPRWLATIDARDERIRELEEWKAACLSIVKMLDDVAARRFLTPRPQSPTP